jgi:nucleoside-diphosphate-sugar epimerase
VFTEDYNGRLNLSNARACYNESKRTSEALCQSYIAEKGVKVKIARLCRVFGPTMLESDSKASSQFIKKAVAGEDIVLKSKGEQYFSYTYVADAVAGLLVVLLKGDVGVPYNVSSEKTNIRLKDFAQMCAEACDRKVVFDLPTDIESKGYSTAQRAILNNDRIKAIGFQPKYEMHDAILRTIEILKTANNG